MEKAIEQSGSLITSEELEAGLNTFLDVSPERQWSDYDYHRHNELVSRLKRWLQVGVHEKYLKPIKKFDSKRVCEERYGPLPPFYRRPIDTINEMLCKPEPSLTSLSEAIVAWKLESVFLNQVDEVGLNIRALEKFFKSKNPQPPDAKQSIEKKSDSNYEDWGATIEDVGSEGHIKLKKDEREFALVGRADILTDKCLYMIYELQGEIGIDVIWAFIYLNVLNLIFKKEELSLLILPQDGRVEEIEIPNVTSNFEHVEELYNFLIEFFVCPIPEAKQNRARINEIFSKSLSTIKETKIEIKPRAFSTESYIEQVMGKWTHFLGFSKTTWIKAMLGNDFNKWEMGQITLFRISEWYYNNTIQSAFLELLKLISHILYTKTIYHVDIFIYKLIADGGFIHKGLNFSTAFEAQDVVSYIQDNGRYMVPTMQDIVRDIDNGVQLYKYENKYDKEKKTLTFEVEVSTAQERNLKTFLEHNGMTQIIRDNFIIQKNIFLKSNLFNNPVDAYFKAVDFWGGYEDNTSSNCMSFPFKVKKLEASLLLGAKQKVQLKVQIAVVKGGVSSLFWLEFSWSLKKWYERDNEDINNNAAFTSFLNNLYKRHEDGSLMPLMVLQDKGAFVKQHIEHIQKGMLDNLLLGCTGNLIICPYSNEYVGHEISSRSVSFHEKHKNKYFECKKNSGAFMVSLQDVPSALHPKDVIKNIAKEAKKKAMDKASECEDISMTAMDFLIEDGYQVFGKIAIVEHTKYIRQERRQSEKYKLSRHIKNLHR